jgi:hypothetical protein
MSMKQFFIIAAIFFATSAHAQQAVTIEKINPSAGFVQGSAPGSPAPPNSTISVQNPALDPCQTQAHNYTPVNMVTATTFQIATPTASKKNYLCHLFLYAWGTDNVAVMEGSSSTCTGGTVAGVIGGATAATGLALTATNPGFESGTGANAIAANGTVNQSICLITSAAVQLSGVAVWVTQ